MDWLTFIATIVKALAWPVTLAIILFLLRHSLISLIPGLSRLRWKDLEFEFKNEVKQVKAEAAQVLPEAVKRETEESSEQMESLQLISINPRAAIIDAWRTVAEAASKTLAKRGYKKTPFPQTSGYVGRLLKEYDVLDSNTLVVYDRLRELRNRVIFNKEFRVPQKEALDYVVTATSLARFIESKG